MVTYSAKCERCEEYIVSNHDDIMLCATCFRRIFIHIEQINLDLAKSLYREYSLILKISTGLADKYLLDEYKNLL